MQGVSDQVQHKIRTNKTTTEGRSPYSSDFPDDHTKESYVQYGVRSDYPELIKKLPAGCAEGVAKLELEIAHWSGQRLSSW